MHCSQLLVSVEYTREDVCKGSGEFGFLVFGGVGGDEILCVMDEILFESEG
jgi:hypothetical protein